MELSTAFSTVSVSEGGFTVVFSTMGKLAAGEGSRDFTFAEIVAFRVDEGNLLQRPNLAIEGPLGRTDLPFKKDQKSAVMQFVDLIRERAPQAIEGSVTEQLQVSAGVREAAEKAGDRGAFILGEYGKKLTSFEGVDLFEKAIRFGGKAWEISGAEISLEMGAPKSRMTLTRIGTGALLFGGAGAVVGGLSRKNKQKGFIEIVTADGGFIIEFHAKNERRARAFVLALKKAAQNR